MGIYLFRVKIKSKFPLSVVSYIHLCGNTSYAPTSPSPHSICSLFSFTNKASHTAVDYNSKSPLQLMCHMISLSHRNISTSAICRSLLKDFLFPPFFGLRCEYDRHLALTCKQAHGFRGWWRNMTEVTRVPEWAYGAEPPSQPGPLPSGQLFKCFYSESLH